MRIHSINIKEFETNCDGILRQSIKHIFNSETDPITLIKIKDIYESMEEIADKCQIVANNFETIIMKIAKGYIFMSYIIIVTIAVVIFSLIFDFINGFHDTANAVATAVSTRALTPKTAILMAAVMNFIGALTFTGVAGTITKDIVDPFKLENGLVVVLAAILAAIIWNLATWFYGIPSSSSHALIGSIAGAAIASEGSFGVLHYQGFTKIIIVLIVSPIIAFCVGFLMYSILKLSLKCKFNKSES